MNEQIKLFIHKFKSWVIQNHVALAHALAFLSSGALLILSDVTHISLARVLPIGLPLVAILYIIFVLPKIRKNPEISRLAIHGYVAGIAATLVYTLFRWPAVILKVIPDIPFLLGDQLMQVQDVYWERTGASVVFGYCMNFFITGAGWGSAFSVLKLWKFRWGGTLWGVAIGSTFLLSPVFKTALTFQTSYTPMWCIATIVLLSHVPYGWALGWIINKLNDMVLLSTETNNRIGFQATVRNLTLHPGKILEKYLDDLVNKIEDTDKRIDILVAAAGKQFFSDWPIDETPNELDQWTSVLNDVWKIKLQDSNWFQLNAEWSKDLNSDKITEITLQLELVHSQKIIEVNRSSFLRWIPVQLQSAELQELKRLVALNDLLSYQKRSENEEINRLRIYLNQRAGSIFERIYLEQGSFYFNEGEPQPILLPVAPTPWSLKYWIQTLIAESIQIEEEILSLDTIKWISNILATDRFEIEYLKPENLDQAIGSLAGYYKNWQDKDISKQLGQVLQQNPKEIENSKLLKIKRQFELIIYHIRRAIIYNSINDEMKKIAHLFDQDLNNLWNSRSVMSKFIKQI